MLISKRGLGMKTGPVRDPSLEERLTKKAMVLAAGFGTRLRPLTEHLPKPLIPVANRPLISYALDLLGQAGVEQVAINLHHLQQTMQDQLALLTSDLKLVFSVEETILGTGGGLVRMQPFFDEGPFFLVNGDVLSLVDLQDVADYHRSMGASATMVVRPFPEGESFTPLLCDDRGHLVRLKHGCVADARNRPLRECMFCGLHVLEPEIFNFLPPEGFSCINDHAYTAMLQAGLTIGAYWYEGLWFDLGTPARYLEANNAVLSGCFPFADDQPKPDSTGVLIDPLAQVDVSSHLGPMVSIAAGSSIGPNARLSNAIVWPQTQVAASSQIDSAIVSPWAIVGAKR